MHAKRKNENLDIVLVREDGETESYKEGVEEIGLD